jgi:predicted enzyme related to lactoylglutathione lyase
VTTGIKTVIYPVMDLAQAKSLYGTILGVKPDMDEDYYVGFSVGGQHIGLDPNGHKNGMTGPVGYWHVENIHESIKELLAAGAVEHQPIQDVGGHRLVASVTDADGNVIGLIQAG